LKGEGENNAVLKEVMLSGMCLTKLINNHLNQINLEEEINRNMKGKFKLLGHIGLMLFLVSALVLTLAPVAQAATAVTEVWVDFPYLDAQNDVSCGTNEYLVHFKPTTALSRGADWVTVTFPDGTSTMGPAAFTVGAVAAADATFSTDYGTEFTATWVASTEAAEVNGYRVKVRIPIDVAAGADVWLSIDSTNIVTPSNVSNTYKVYVQTTKDTTRVISSEFSLDDSVISTDAVTVTTATAGVASEYIFTFTTASAQQSIVTVRFPVGTVLPASIDIDELLFSTDAGSTYVVSGSTPVVDVARRTVTAQSSVTFDADANNRMKILVAAGITNPTTVGATYYPMIKTNIDAQWRLMDSSVTAIVAGTATKLAFTTASDNATILNAYTGALVLQAQDVNGNLVSDTSDVLVAATTGTGTVHESQSGTGVDLWGVSTPLSGGTISAYYLPTTVGTHVLTATDVETVPTLASATITIYVAPAVVLTDSVGNTIGTYGPAVDSWGSDVGGTYIQQAIDAAASGDTVTLGDGIYELSAAIDLDKLITLTAASGATPTLRPTTDALDAIVVNAQGTAANPIIIDGLTFTRLNSSVQFAQGVYNNGWDYVTVRNCAFNYMFPSQGAGADHEKGAVVAFVIQGSVGGGDNPITSGTISNNTFANCLLFETTNKEAVINVMTKELAGSGDTITGVTVSGNTITDCNGYGIILNGYRATSSYVTATVSNNILTNVYDAINIQRFTSGVRILGNTVTGAYQYGLRVEYCDAGTQLDLVIKNNTFTGVAGAHPRDAVVIIDQDSGLTADPVTLQYNAIYDNDATYSIKVDPQVVGITQAQYNWYGSASGPGTSVSGLAADVTYSPWLHKSLVDVVAANASYPALTVSLSTGWNTLSTPAKLMSSGDALNELVPAGVTIAYKYDSVLGWVQVTTDVLNPCEAFYVKMSSAQTVLLQVDGGTTWVPSKDLAAGWNMIGLASLTTKTDADATASVYGSFGQLVSPSMNAAEWVYVSGAATANSLAVGEGYWIFMTEAATLGGFTLCPIAPDLE